MEIAGRTGVEAGRQRVLFRHQLGPLWPNNENLVVKGFWFGVFFLDGEKHMGWMAFLWLQLQEVEQSIWATR